MIFLVIYKLELKDGIVTCTDTTTGLISGRIPVGLALELANMLIRCNDKEIPAVICVGSIV
jgi:hypothetical protein